MSQELVAILGTQEGDRSRRKGKKHGGVGAVDGLGVTF
jgi:hypothetical protein